MNIPANHPQTSTARRSIRQRRRCGAVAVETGIVLSLILMMIFGIMEYGRYIMTLQLFDNAAREGCRYAVTHTNAVTLNGTTYQNTTTAVTNVVTSFLAGQTLSGQSVQVYASDAVGNNTGTWTNATAGQSVCVKITGNFQVAVLSLIGLPSTLPIVAQSVMDVESN